MLLQGEKLIERARMLGVDVMGDRIIHSSSGRREFAEEFELQRRVMEAERSRRDSYLWAIAIISALASVLSALAAWFAVLK